MIERKDEMREVEKDHTSKQTKSKKKISRISHTDKRCVSFWS